MADRISELRDRLISDASIEGSENISSDVIDRWIREGIAKHSPQYTSETLPTEEDEAVVVLAWISLCYQRAGKLSDKPDLTGPPSGIGVNADSPYRRVMNLANALQSRYERIVAANESDDSGNIVQGNLVMKSEFTERATGKRPSNVRIALSKGTVTATTAVLTWSATWRDDFCDFYIFADTNPGIYQPTNFGGRNNVKYVAPTADQLLQSGDQNLKALTVEDLEPSTEYFFVVVMWTNRDQWHFSNEVRVLTPAS